jgi:putative transposase
MRSSVVVSKKAVKMSETRLSGHGKYNTVYHVVWVTKYRRHILTPRIKAYLDKLFKKVLEAMPSCELLEYNIQLDHIHMVMIIPPKYSVKDVIGRLKGISASRLKRRLSFSKSVWSPGYFVRTVGLAEDKIIEYVRNQ